MFEYDSKLGRRLAALSVAVWFAAFLVSFLEVAIYGVPVLGLLSYIIAFALLGAGVCVGLFSIIRNNEKH